MVSNKSCLETKTVPGSSLLEDLFGWIHWRNIYRGVKIVNFPLFCVYKDGTRVLGFMVGKLLQILTFFFLLLLLISHSS